MNHRMVSQQLFVESKNNRRIGKLVVNRALNDISWPIVTNEVISEKGGVRKTTTVATLGHALAQRGLRALLVDLDPQANLTARIGTETPPEAKIANGTRRQRRNAVLRSDLRPPAPRRWRPMAPVRSLTPPPICVQGKSTTTVILWRRSASSVRIVNSTRTLKPLERT
jgi:hypothetical protein